MEKDSGMEKGLDLKSPMELRKVVNNDEEGGASISEQHPIVTEWMDLFAKEMVTASNLEDARNRAAKALVSLEQSIVTVIAEATQNLRQENAVLKEEFSKSNSSLRCSIFDQQTHRRYMPYEIVEAKKSAGNDFLTRFEEWSKKEPTEYDKLRVEAILNKREIPYREPDYVRDPDYSGMFFFDSKGLKHPIGLGMADESSEDESY